MLRPSTTLRAAHPLRTSTHHAAVKPASTKAATPAPKLLRFIFQPTPSAINCCTQNTTIEYLENWAHPYHIRTKRRLAAFDPDRLHWSVGANVEVAKKRVVRSWVKRRVEAAVRAELKDRGWRSDGTVVAAKGEEAVTGARIARAPIKGALKIFMPKDNRKEVITASGEEVRQNVRAILNEVVRKQALRGSEQSQGTERATRDRMPARGKAGAKSRTKTRPARSRVVELDRPTV